MSKVQSEKSALWKEIFMIRDVIDGNWSESDPEQSDGRLARRKPFRIWMIEVNLGDGHWFPMYQPCYSLPEAQKKLKRQPKNGPSKYRIQTYIRENWGPDAFGGVNTSIKEP